MASELNMPRILCYSREPEKARSVAETLKHHYDVVCPESLEDSLETLNEGQFSGLFLCGSEMTSAGLLLQAGGILHQLHDGFALVGHRREVLWHNARLLTLTDSEETHVGRSFYECFSAPTSARSLPHSVWARRLAAR
jgi:hypothetical protein